MGRFEKSGICLVIAGEEEDFLRFVNPDGPGSYAGQELVGTSNLIEKATGVEHTDWSDEFYFRTPQYSDHQLNIDSWRGRTGRKWPQFFKVKITVEAEPVDDVENERLWLDIQKEKSK